jgi:DNA helicase-4
MKNKKQQKKTLKSNKHLEKPIVIYYRNNLKKALKELLTIIDCESIMVLGRNNKDIYNYIDEDFTQDQDIFRYKNKTFRYLTIHKSKGLEAENVILINVIDNIIGLPTKLTQEKILKYVNNTKDYYPYEEERRLFYVALTRTKTYTYLIASKNNYSIFIKELFKYKKYIQIIKK